MARKSSKTAHVMNLLAGEDSEISKSEAAKENLAASLNSDSSETIKELTVLAHQASIQTQEGPLSPSPISIIDMSSSAPDPVSELIRQQLEEEEGFVTNSPDENLEKLEEPGELEESEELELNQDISEHNKEEANSFENISEEEEKERKEEDAEDPSPVVTASDVKIFTTTTQADSEGNNNQSSAATNVEENLESISEDTSLEEKAESTFEEADFVENNDPVPDISATEEMAEPEPTKSGTKEEPKATSPKIPTYQYLNVMEYVVKSIVDDYVTKFDACSCDRCIADITALALTKLPPKYIVVESPSASPLLNFYTNRYSHQVIVELMKACSIVKQNPHH